VYPYILRVDPRDLLTGGNIRKVGEVRVTRPDLVDSVIAHGMDSRISIVAVADEEAGLQVLQGFHRTAAAVAVKEQERPDLMMDVVVHAPGTTRRELLIIMGNENMHRADLTEAEELALFADLEGEGEDAGGIAKAFSVPRERVQAGLAVARAPRTRQAAEDLHGIDMFALAALAGFEDDPAAHEELQKTLRTAPGRFDDVLGRLERQRAHAAMRSEAVAELEAQGYAIVLDEQDDGDYDDYEEDGDGEEEEEGSATSLVKLSDLCSAEDMEPLDHASHAECPGRAVQVWVDDWKEKVEVAEYCVDPAQYGHRSIAALNVELLQAELRAANVRVIGRDELEAEGTEELHRICPDPGGEHCFTEESHAGCPGHAGYVYAGVQNRARVRYVCTDYEGQGHTRRTFGAAQPVAPAFAAAERKRAKVNNMLWKEAREERRAWLKRFFVGWRKKKPSDLPKRVQHWLALASVLAPGFLHDASATQEYAVDLLGLRRAGDESCRPLELTVAELRKKTSDQQAVMIRLAQVLGACEAHWSQKFTEQADASWRSRSTETRFYFELLGALGYELSHVERLINEPELDNEHWPHLAEPEVEPEVESDEDFADEAE
jgi:ParB family chromosome partitioning protein